MAHLNTIKDLLKFLHSCMMESGVFFVPSQDSGLTAPFQLQP
jgi:hypothetical protein